MIFMKIFEIQCSGNVRSRDDLPRKGKRQLAVTVRVWRERRKTAV
jgi:hypothetical protein